MTPTRSTARRALLAALAALAGVLLLATAAQARDVTFGGADGNQYAPSSVTINPGEVVRWIGDFAKNPLVSASAEDFGYDGPQTDYSHTFSRPGVYRFYSRTHGAKTGDNTVSGMAGEVTVVDPGGGAVTAPPSGLPPASLLTPAIAISVSAPSTLHNAARRSLTTKVLANAGGAVKLALKAGTTTIARGSVTLAKGGAKTVRLKIGPTGQRLLQRRRTLTATLSATITGAKEATATATQRVKLSVR